MPISIALPLPRCDRMPMALHLNTQTSIPRDIGQLTSPYSSSNSSPPSSYEDISSALDKKHIQFVCPRPERFLERCAKRPYKGTPPLNSAVLKTLSQLPDEEIGLSEDDDGYDDEFSDDIDEFANDDDYFACVNRGSVSERRLRQCGFEEDDDTGESTHTDLFDLET